MPCYVVLSSTFACFVLFVVILLKYNLRQINRRIINIFQSLAVMLTRTSFRIQGQRLSFLPVPRPSM